MNRQRKVVITITYNEMGIIIDTKAEEVAQPNLQPTCNQLATNLQPTCNELATNCISRQAAIDAIHEDADWLASQGSDWQVERMERDKSILRSLPPAQPEPCDDPRADIYYLAEKIGIHRLYALVVELRGEPEPCEDAVSRQAAIAVADYTDYTGLAIEDVKKVTDEVVKGLKQLPSVQPEVLACGEGVLNAQPETARRIVGKSRNGMTLWYQCEMCNEPVDAQDNFCRGCGRRLTDE